MSQAKRLFCGGIREAASHASHTMALHSRWHSIQRYALQVVDLIFALSKPSCTHTTLHWPSNAAACARNCKLSEICKVCRLLGATCSASLQDSCAADVSTRAVLQACCAPHQCLHTGTPHSTSLHFIHIHAVSCCSEVILHAWKRFKMFTACSGTTNHHCKLNITGCDASQLQCSKEAYKKKHRPMLFNRAAWPSMPFKLCSFNR